MYINKSNPIEHEDSCKRFESENPLQIPLEISLKATEKVTNFCSIGKNIAQVSTCQESYCVLIMSGNGY